MRTGEVFVSKWLSDRIVEEAGRRIYESQQSRLSDQTTFAARRTWRSDDVPEKFWDSYIEDARAALSLISIATVVSDALKQNNKLTESGPTTPVRIGVMRASNRHSNESSIPIAKSS
jgi:hypothetical protein